jgi:hypothetical protein
MPSKEWHLQHPLGVHAWEQGNGCGLFFPFVNCSAHKGWSSSGCLICWAKFLSAEVLTGVSKSKTQFALGKVSFWTFLCPVSCVLKIRWQQTFLMPIYGWGSSEARDFFLQLVNNRCSRVALWEKWEESLDNCLPSSHISAGRCSLNTLDLKGGTLCSLLYCHSYSLQGRALRFLSESFCWVQFG